MRRQSRNAFGEKHLKKLAEAAKSLVGAEKSEKTKKADNQQDIKDEKQVAKANAESNKNQNQVFDDDTTNESKTNMKNIDNKTEDFMDLVNSALNEADAELELNDVGDGSGVDDMELEFGGEDEQPGGEGLEGLVQQLCDVVDAIKSEVLGGDDYAGDDMEMEGDYDDDLEDIPEEDAQLVGTPLNGQTKGDNLKSKKHSTGHKPGTPSGSAGTTTQVAGGFKTQKGKKSRYEGEKGTSSNKVKASKKNNPGDDLIA